jgi:hypothetical protein
MLTLDNHPQTSIVKDAVLKCVSDEDRGRICIGKPVYRQTRARIVVENFDVVCVSELLKLLPKNSKVFSRAPTQGGDSVVLSRLEIYYGLESSIWINKGAILSFLWLFIPIVASFFIVTTREL